MIRNSKELDELFSKLFSFEIPMSYSELDQIGEYITKNPENISKLQLMKFVSLMYQVLKNHIISLQKSTPPKKKPKKKRTANKL